MFDLTGKCALVTGASGGIGGAIAKALHGAGATVGLSGTRVEPLEALAAECRKLNSEKAGTTILSVTTGSSRPTSSTSSYSRSASSSSPSSFVPGSSSVVKDARTSKIVAKVAALNLK